ncbi:MULTISPECIES: translesion error-prone DNA polymerase V autoproteolytic subunit [unclassified Anaerobiospirillum]|uniref:LexA family protein n=1 Tax=unclassified Anaerobiospirillum TaxID=2647410 RepID=UPI001FF4FCF5|nr:MULTISPECIES: translesion error-prone DNA polymerase V autoproteolytic subunit [unclassified Anaerobiospirillum]MCK0527502.1 translesion error-prone DNA polymerase V autoproteolytic subunit [Anaerobiospirillum sp. NML120449]MCK0535907.1 translesion error-prone DNA polymerase V autoproteolytic subunit [Anaerobiospirillum sp. NML120511]MCK0539886.1 translesion error-prone DNA polymerase V autoproteolytic subunit [Anaerobiospirillum sp. NML02-A-032]
MADRVIPHGVVPNPKTTLSLPVAFETIQAGFPAPNGGYIDGNLDVNEFLVSHPSSTYIYRVAGDSMIEAGIMPDDFVLVDSSIEPRSNDIVVAMVDGEYTIKKLVKGPPPQLVPCNKEYSPIFIGEYTEVTVIGPVISVIRKYH